MLISVSEQTKIYIVHGAVDFRNQHEGLTSICRNVLYKEPSAGAVFLFRNKCRNAVKLLYYDGQGWWVAHKKLEKGKFRVWPEDAEKLSSLQAHELLVLLKNGNPFAAKFQPNFKPVTLT